MIKRVQESYPCLYHENNVAGWVDKIQGEGYVVTSIVPVSRTFLMFGNSITDIYYEKTHSTIS